MKATAFAIHAAIVMFFVTGVLGISFLGGMNATTFTEPIRFVLANPSRVRSEVWLLVGAVAFLALAWARFFSKLTAKPKLGLSAGMFLLFTALGLVTHCPDLYMYPVTEVRSTIEAIAGRLPQFGWSEGYILAASMVWLSLFWLIMTIIDIIGANKIHLRTVDPGRVNVR